MSIFFIPDDSPEMEEYYKLFDQAKKDAERITATGPELYRVPNKTIFDFIIEILGAEQVDDRAALCPNGCTLYWNEISDALPTISTLVTKTNKITIYGL